MKKTISVPLIVVLCLAVFVTQALAFGSAKPKDPPGPDNPPPGKVIDHPKGNDDKPEKVKPNPKGIENPPGQVKDKDNNSDKDKTKPPAGKKYHLKGEVLSYEGGMLEIGGKHGGTVQVDGSTVIKVAGKDEGITGIAAGQQVAAQAVKVDDGLLALRVTIYPNKPARVHRVGIVTAYEAGVSITIDGTTTFAIAPGAKILPESRALLLDVGARVTVISPASVSKETLTATGIVVHPVEMEDEDDGEEEEAED